MMISQATPELAVRNVLEAQEYFRNRLGFRIEWHNIEGKIGAVSHGDCALFFRETEDQIHPGTFWIFAQDIDVAFDELAQLGADIIDPIEDKPWGMRQFTVQDLNLNKFYFHHEIGR